MKLRRLKSTFAFALLGTSLIFPSGARAAGLGDYYLSPEAGFAILNAGAGLHPSFGLVFAGRLASPLFLGAFYNYIPYGSVSSPNGTSVSGSEKFYGFQLLYDFSPMMNGFMAGARAGFSSVSTQSFTSAGGEFDDSSTGLGWGPMLSYDRPISPSFTFGGEMVIMLPSESHAPNVFELIATLKWWF